MDYKSALLGALGFAAFEGLRVYKLLNRNKAPYPKRFHLHYTVCIIVLLGFSATVAVFLSNGNASTALFVGFSVPTAVRAFASKDISVERNSPTVEVDDIQLESGHSRSSAFSSYFDF